MSAQLVIWIQGQGPAGVPRMLDLDGARGGYGGRIAANLNWLDQLADGGGYGGLSGFVSDATWFDPEDGLDTVECLVADVDSGENNDLKWELQCCQQILRKANEAGLEFRFHYAA